MTLRIASVYALFLAILTGAAPAGAADAQACRTLTAAMAAAPPGPVFLASYPAAPAGPLHNAAFLYDNAAAALALIGCGEATQAQRIGQAILIAQAHDRYWHDGRLRNAYAAGAVTDRPVKLPGWWDAKAGVWREDRYQVGSDNGNMAWAMLALLALDHDRGDPAFRRGAERLGAWTAGFANALGPGGYQGGTFAHEPEPQRLTWKSTEHNTDLFAAFSGLFAATGNPAWRDRAAEARHMVEAMWQDSRDYFDAGTGPDGVTPNPILALDAQIWPLLALPGAARRLAGRQAPALARLRSGDGYAYSEAQGGLWTEGTAQAALLAGLLGHEAEAKRLLAAVADQRAPDGGYYATPENSLPTGFMLDTDPAKPRLYFHLSHLGATAWAALAQKGFNPFTATSTLPR